MKKFKNFIISRLSAGEAGQALILVLIFLVLGSLTLVPTLTHIGTALKTGEIYEEATNEIYAADSGVEDAIWRIKYDAIDPDYKAYDFNTTWNYQLDDHINNETTNVTIQNIWIPSNTDPPDDPVAAEETIKLNKLVVAGTSSTCNTTCKIVISFYPENGENLTVNSIGVWLPDGFTYEEGSSNLEAGMQPYYSIPVTTDHCGGQAVVWNFADLNFTDFPGPGADGFVAEGDIPQVAEITFQIDPDVEDTRPTTISWLNTSDYGIIDDILPCTWDVDTRIYKILSKAGDTEVEAYSSRNELRKMISAIAGDYVATGNTVLYGTGGYRKYWTNPEHSSSSTVNNIPNSENESYGDVISAYLYWSGWFNESTKTSVFSDTCSNFNNWLMANQTKLPDADGDFNGTWVPTPGSPTTRYDKVAETTPDGNNDFITSPTATGGGYNLFTFTPFSITSGLSIDNLTVYITAQDAANGNNNIRPAVKINGGTNPYPTSSGNNPPNQPTWTTFDNPLFATNPKTGSAWTPTDLSNPTSTNGLQQFGVWSNDLSPAVKVTMVYAQVNYSCWNVSSNQFRGKGVSSATSAERTLTLKNSQSIPYTFPERVRLSWYQKTNGALESDDGLDFSFSTDGGLTWSEDFVAFRDDLTSDKERYFKYIIPTEYQSGTFKIRFKLIGFNESNDDYCYLDDIKIEKVYPDDEVTFKIRDPNPPYLEHTETITAAKIQVLPNASNSYANHGYSYSSYADVTSLVETYAEVIEDEFENEHHTGNGDYTVGDIWASVNDDWSYAGWSLIIIYSSPNTAGHELYLYDQFMYSDMYNDVDFDNDGEMGGIISGFAVPEQMPGEVNAGKLTCFVGEGDLGSASWGDDFIAFNAPESYWKGPWADPFSIPNMYKLYDGMSCWNNSPSVPNNVWNNKSVGLSKDGIDIDTFDIPWATEQKPWFLEPGDSSARIDLPTEVDSWNLIYMILSFRSKTVIGGTTHYVIRND